SCRTAALGGHVVRCEDCAHTAISYNSCRNRHCPKCQGAAAREWMAAREAELLPVAYFHVVFTLPSEIGDIAYQNKAVIYDLLFKASAETMLTIAADPRHLGARVGFSSVPHTWRSAMTHHPHVHMIVPGGGIAADGSRWISCKLNFLLPVRVLSKLFRRLMLTKLAEAHAAGQLQFFGIHARLTDAKAFAAFLAPLRKKRWFVYSKRPFAGPKALLTYLSPYTPPLSVALPPRGRPLDPRPDAVGGGGAPFKRQAPRDGGPGRVPPDAARRRQFHPPLPHPRPAKGLPPHPPLRPVRRQQACRNDQDRAEALEPRPACDRGECSRCFDKSSADQRGRSVTAARPPLPLLRRPHVRHRNFRARPPAASSAHRTSRRNQDRHLMIASTISRIIARVSCWSSTGNATARPNRSTALPMSLGASPKYRDS